MSLDIKTKIKKDHSWTYSLSNQKLKRDSSQGLNQTQTQKIQSFEETQSRILKPLPNKEFLELIDRHSTSLKSNINEKNKHLQSQKLKAQQHQKANYDVTVNDLSKDFMQIVNLKKKSDEDKNKNDQKYLLCEIDPESELYQPIESLRKLLFKESDDEDLKSGDSSSGDSFESSPKYQSNQFKKSPTLRRKSKRQNRDRSDIELYMDSVEQELKKKISSSTSSVKMEIIQKLQDFYQKCFTQFMMELASVNFDLKNVASRICNGVELTFQALIRHHFLEIQQLQNKIDEQNKDMSNLQQAYLFLKNDIKMINRIAPQFCEILASQNVFQSKNNQGNVFNFNLDTIDDKSPKRNNKPVTERERYINAIQENEEKLQAITQIENMIAIRNSHNLKNKPKDSQYNIDKLIPSDAEQSLKSILSDIKTFQDKNLNEIRMALSVEKDEQEMEHDIEKQQRIILKDWTGERNTKIKLVQKKLVDKMATKLDKPRCKDQGILTEQRFITEEEFERLRQLNTQFHRQLALNGQLFSMKEKQMDDLKQHYILSDLNWKKADRQLNDIRLLNSVKKSFLMEIKNEYDDIVLGILNICTKFANDIKSQNSNIKLEIQDNEYLQEVLNTQRKSVDDYLFALLESKKVVNDLAVSQQVQKASKHFTEQAEHLMKIGELTNGKLQELKQQRKSQIHNGNSSHNTESSTDSVQQVMNSKIEYEDHHIKSFEKAKLKQRYSIAPKILKKQILLINQQLQEQQDIRKSSFSQLRQAYSGENFNYPRTQASIPSAFKQRKTISHKTSPSSSQYSDSDQYQQETRIMNERKQLAQDAQIVRNKTILGNFDDSAIIKERSNKQSFIETNNNVIVKIKEPNNQGESQAKNQVQQEAQIVRKPRFNIDADKQLKERIRLQQEELDKILSAPIHFDKFVHNQQGFVRIREDEINSNEPEKMQQISKDLEGLILQSEQILKLDDQMKQGNITPFSPGKVTAEGFTFTDLNLQKYTAEQKPSVIAGGLAEITEESEESFNQKNDPNHFSDKKSSRAAPSQVDQQSQRQKSKQGQKRSITKAHTELSNQEIQTEQFLDDFSQRIQNSLNYLNMVIESQIDFKTEVQNLSFNTKMMSEAKINSIRLIFQQILRKAYSEQIILKPIANQNSSAVSKISQFLGDGLKSQNNKRQDSQRNSYDSTSKSLIKSDSRPFSRNPVVAPQSAQNVQQNIQESQSQDMIGNSSIIQDGMIKIQNMLQNQNLSIIKTQGYLDPKSAYNAINQANMINHNYRQQIINQGLNQIISQNQNKQLPLKVNIQEKLNQVQNQKNQQEDTSSFLLNQSNYQTKLTPNLSSSAPKDRQSLINQINSNINLPIQQQQQILDPNNSNQRVLNGDIFFEDLKGQQNQQQFNQDNNTTFNINISQIDQQQQLSQYAYMPSQFKDNHNLRSVQEINQSGKNNDLIGANRKSINTNINNNPFQLKLDPSHSSSIQELQDRQMQTNETIPHSFNQTITDNYNMLLQPIFMQNSEMIQDFNDWQQQFEDMDETSAQQLLEKYNQLYNQRVNKEMSGNFEMKQKENIQNLQKQLTPYEQYKIKSTLAKGNLTEEQKFYYLRVLQDQMTDNNNKKQLNRSASSTVIQPKNNLVLGPTFNIHIHRKKSKKQQPRLEPIQAVKLSVPAQLQQKPLLNQTAGAIGSEYNELTNQQLEQNFKIINKSQSLKQLIPKSDDQQQQQKQYLINLNQITPEYLMSDSPLASFQQMPEKQKSPIRDFNLPELQHPEVQRQNERDKVFKELIQSHANQKKSKNEKKNFTYRDRKKSIEDMEKQGNTYQDTTSYSKEGKRLDYLPFN